jgi:hypothetical protein
MKNGSVVDPRGDEVPRLVRRQHRHHGGGVGQTAGPVSRQVRADVIEPEEQRLPAGGAGGERRHAGQKVEQRLQPEPWRRPRPEKRLEVVPGVRVRRLHRW